MASFYEELNQRDAVSDERENSESRKKMDQWIFYSLLVLIGFMPLIVMANVQEVISPLISNVDVLSSGIKGDLFTHYKALMLLIVTLFVSALFLGKIFFMGGTIRKTYLNYVLGVFVVAIVVSTIASPNTSIALNGQYNHSDGAISWLCYVALLFIAMNIEYPKNVIKYIVYTMMPFVYINLYIITMNFYGKDLLQNAWAQSLVSIMLPEGSSISEGSALVGTLNQWNYMSGMFAMMTVMYLAWAVTSQKWVDNIVGAVTASAAIIVMFMSVSTSGFLTVLVVGAVILVAALLTKKKGQAVVSLAIFFLIAAPVFHVLAEKDYRVWTESFGFFTEKNPYMEEVTALLNTTNVAHASKEVLELPVLPERATAAGSGRTYIWDKTLDLVGNRAILGYGNDTLIYNFPHYSLDARSGMKDENTITDKPHNQFVGVLYGFGIFGLVALVMLVVATGIAAFRAIIKKAWAELVLALTILAYFSQSMFNDSLPASSGFTFVLIGILFAQQVIKSQENAVNGRNN
ncbi:O-antigen ligase family protein [Solibacillus sp. FSL R7-0668]|uniref:O-antigen ligase family protein n=1 Tax=Solibacillus sp. FSL R7-0668 TaxID=2921688 RepID=UPI0030F76B0F